MSRIPAYSSDDVPEKRIDKDEVVVGKDEKEVERRRTEQEAMKAAKRAGERLKKDQANDEFHNIGPI